MIDFSIVDNHILENIYQNKISGASLAVYKDGELVHKKYFGLADIEKNLPIDGSTRFRLASMTKPITAVAIMICEEQGLLNSDDYVDQYIEELKDFIVKDKDYNIIDNKKYRIKISQLLSHTSGFGSGELEGKDFDKYVPEKERYDLSNVVHFYKDFSLSFIPGSFWSYSALSGFDILARIVEVVSKMKYEDFLKKYLFQPLNMDSTSYSYKEKDNKAISYISENGKLIFSDDKGRGFDFFLPGYNGGGAGLISTLDDYSSFALMLSNFGTYNGHVFISKERFLKMLRFNPTPNFISGGLETFGYSFYIRTNTYQKLPLGSFGWSGAYGPHFWVDPKNNIVVVYMHSSSTYGGAGAEHANQLESDIVDVFHLK